VGKLRVIVRVGGEAVGNSRTKRERSKEPLLSRNPPDGTQDVRITIKNQKTDRRCR